VTIVIVSHELSVVGTLCRPRRRHRARPVAEQFALSTTTSGPAAAQDGAGPRTGVLRHRGEARGLGPMSMPEGGPMPENIAAILPELWTAFQTF
jgi:hypothetical protein